MALNTDFNVAPYYDDYNEEKNFHRVLFRPAVPVQARELTQLQTILQNQVERFGDNIYRQGTIIKGCSITFDFNYSYVKIKDLQVDGQATLVSDYAGGILKDSSNLTSSIVNYVQGLESQNPDLSTLFIKYTNTGSGSKKKYANDDVLTVYANDYSIQTISITAAGTLYDNTDIVVFTGGDGTGASANIVTYANGSIRDVVITNGGSGYTTAPALSITTSTGSSGSLTAVNYIAQIRVANSSYTNPVGVGSAATIADGVIYQRGHFVRVAEQTTIIDKYTNEPDGISLGFLTTESVVNNSVDTTLLDNAQGYSNYTAPGAYRLKLTPTLISISTTNAASNSEFLSIVEFKNGRISKRRTETEFNSVASELAKRTREESGNYVVKPFNIYTEEKASNTTHLNLSVSAGIGYVDGFRSEIAGTIRVPVRKGTDTSTSNNQTISTNYGNYVVVSEVLGNFDFSSGLTVNLRNTAATDGTDNFGGAPTTPGSVIGTARVKSFMYESGTPGTPSCKYRIYLHDIVMSSGNKFSSVRSIQTSGGVADVVLEDSKAVLKETSYDTSIFSSGVQAVNYFSNEQFIYRKVASSSILGSGVGTVTLTGSEEFPYTASSTLNDTQELDFIVIPSSNAYSTTNLSGTVSTSGNAVTGTSTSFISELDVGDYIKFQGNNNFYRVSTISSATSMTIEGSTGPAVSANTISYAYPKNIPVRLDRGDANVSIDSNGNTASIYIGNTINTSTTATVYFNSKVDGANPKTKTVVKDVYVKLSTDSLTATTKGPWCIGIPDAYKLVGVYVGSSNTYSNTTTNYVSSFELITGQTDNMYGLSYIRKKPGSTVSLTSSSCLLVRVNCFTHGTGYYLSTESYPVDDSTTPLPSNKIRTEDIPYHRSPKTGKYINLRDAIDFRSIVANTANASATSVSGASIDPSSTETLTGSIYYPTPNEAFEADITHYLKRIDTITIDTAGNINVVEGKPDNDPVPPRSNDGTMKLGTIFIPPYPSLSPKSASQAQRNEYATLIKQDQVVGYTMKDIKQIEERINRLEYYSLLNTLEKSASDLVIPSESNTSINRFKNGFFVDSFTSYDISNVNDPEYSVFVDTKSGTARPQTEKTNIKLKANTAASSNITFKGEYALLDYTEDLFINQNIANKARNPVQLNYSFASAKVQLYPAYDDYYDVEKGEVNVTVDLATPLNSLAKAINDSVTFKKDSKQVSVSTGSWNTVTAATTQNAGRDERTITTTTTTTKNTIDVSDTKLNVQNVGEFLTDFGMNPYIRAQKVTFVAVGLRPDAVHYVFFDKKDVSSLCRQGRVEDIETMDSRGVDFEPTFRFTKSKGDSLVTDSNGTLVGVFYLPADTFFCGERSLIISDSNDIDTTDSAISFTSASFNAYNFYKDSTSLSITTKVPQTIKAASNTTVDVVKTTDSRVRPRIPTFSGCCFVAGTKITMVDGSVKNIQDVEIGDMVVGKDNNVNKVLNFIRPVLGDRTLISLNGSVPFMTSDHPVYCKDGIWKSYDPDATKKKYQVFKNSEIGKLSVGDIIETLDGVGVKVEKLDSVEGDPELQVYNFSLDGNHTYVANDLIVHNKGGGGSDPLAQTFNINKEDGADGVYVTKVKLYFKEKSSNSTVGITVQIRETDNGYPAPIVLAQKVIKNSNINVSSTAALSTDVVFDTPVYLKSGVDYCLVVTPFQNNPDFKLWVAEVGVPDVANESLISNANWGGGVLFLSSNDKVWTPYQGEDLKFSVYVADFSKTSGTVVLENEDYEFLTLTGTEGTFVDSEEVAQKANSYLSGTFTCNTTSAIVNTSTSQATSVSSGEYVLAVFANSTVSKTGTVSANTTSAQVNGSSTLFSSEYTVGDYLLINGNVRSVNSITNNTILILDAPLSNTVSANAHYGVTENIQISRVNSVNSTAITLKDTPLYQIDGGTTYYGAVQKVVRGTVDKVVNDTVILKNSSAANSTFRFIAGEKIIGETSQATATISSVDDKVVNFTEAHIRYIAPPTSSVSLIQKIDGVTATAANSSIKEGVSNSIKYEAEIKSRSNEIISGSKSFKLYADLSRQSTYDSISPVVDTSPVSVTTIENIVNNDSTDETTRYGNSSVKYISKNVVLADGLDAEDIKVYITAYKPTQADVLVYAKILASDDSDSFDDKDWTLLQQVTESNLHSDSLDETDYIEYEYGFKLTPPSTKLSGVITSSSNTTITGSGTSFTVDLAANDIVKIVDSSTLTGYDIAVVNSIANNTSLTLKTSTTFSSGSASLEKVSQPKAAFKYNRDSNIVTYFDGDKAQHSTYKTFALKIVLLSSSTKYVPILKDLRALAVSI